MPEDNKDQKQKEVTPTSFQNPWRIFAIEAFLFCLTLGLGIAAAFRINKILEIQKIALPQISPGKFIFYFLIATSFVLLLSYLIKFKRGKGIILKILFVFAVSFGGLLSLEVWLSEPVSLIIIVSLILWWWKFPSVFNHDILIILGIAGIGSILGLRLTPEIIIGLLIIFSIYDFIAVYKTKHMVKMAKVMIESKAVLALIIPSSFRDFRGSLDEVRPGGKFLILGGGDIVFPLLFCISLVPQGVLSPLIVAFFSLIGLFVGFWFFISQKTRQPIPALPPIALFSIIGYLITRLI